MEVKNVVVIDKDGTVIPAEVVICAACEAETFILFFADGQEHLHLQCVSCDLTFCSGDGCCS
jgi:hypothetical protein